MINELEKVKITIYAKQIYGNESDETTQNFIGTFKQDDENAYLNYQETDTVTSIKIDKKREQIIVHKKGASNATLKFKSHTESKAHYQTPFGTMDFDIFVKELTLTINETIHLMIVYDLMNQNEKVSTNIFKLTAL